MIEKIPYLPFDGEIDGVVIVKAAVKCGDDVYTGWRHAFIMADLIAIDVITKQNKMTDEMQGFVNQSGQFINREISKCIVLFNRQITTIRGYTLCSEDLWENDGSPLTNPKLG
jgi:hypothetical protein